MDNIFTVFVISVCCGVSYSYPAPTIKLYSKQENSSSNSKPYSIQIGQPISFFAHQNVIVASPVKVKSNRDSNISSRNSNGIDSLEEDMETFDDDFYETDEVLDPDEEIMRKTLCPSTPTGKLRHLYDRKLQKCAPAGTKGHCGDNMIFRMDMSANSTLYGYCECDYDYTENKTPLVYHEATDRCYTIYGRAFCQPKEWLVFNSSGIPVCEARKCFLQPQGRRNKILNHIIEVPLNGTGPCVQLDRPSELCESSEEIVHFHPYEIFPRCGKTGLIRPQLRAISPFFIRRCPPGSYLNIVGKCQQSWSFAW